MKNSKELCIVACGKKKIWDKNPNIGPIKSKKMYTGLFTKKCINYAEKFYKNSYCILSAKYGFLYPDEIIKEPYNECFHQKKTNPISKDKLQLQIKSKKINEFDKIIILGGKYYTNLIKDLFPHQDIIYPLDGCKSIGKMMQKLNELQKK